jgi:2-oxoglutarate dehydrogenase E2 component (dihydrolipoamide succinyltransferase)
VGEPGEALSENGAGEAESMPVADGGPTTIDDRPQTIDGQGEASSGVYTGRISPIVGRIAAEHGINLNKVRGTGRDGRITKEDVLAYVEKTTDDGRQTAAGSIQSADPQPTAAQISPPVDESPVVRGTVEGGELQPLTTMRRTIAEHMVRSKQTSPHVTTVFEFDFSAADAHRRANKDAFARDGVRLTFMAYIVAATVAALKAHPAVNSSWTDEGVLLRREINIGMATALDDGLIVPVIKNADGLNLLGLARTINDLAERARAKQLKPDEVKGGTFSITNHGTTGSLFATPIINQPQAGILGVGAIEKRVKVIDDAIAIRPLAYVSFTFDHRILDGASADAFVSAIKQQIEGWR